MSEQDKLQTTISQPLSGQWPDLSSFNLEDTYNELHRLHVSYHSISHLMIQAERDDLLRTNGGDDGNKFSILKNGANNDKNPDKQAIIPPSNIWLQALQRIEMQRDVLRTHAMALSRPSIRSLHILNLPEDILYEIFSYEQPSRTEVHGRGHTRSKEEKERIKNVQNVRLVCRLFNEFASPYLFPYLQVDLQMESLLRAEKISKIPHLAKGVHEISVGLQYRPQEMAASLKYFQIRKEQDLTEWYRRCDYMTDLEYHKDYEEAPDDYKANCQAMDNHGEINGAWNCKSLRHMRKMRKMRKSGSEPYEEDEVYQHILLEGYENFQRLHKEQFALIMDGTFSRTLAACMARMPQADSLFMTDSMDDRDKYLHSYPDGSIVLNNPGKLADYIVYPCTWGMIESFSNRTGHVQPFKLLPARLLSQLPIAIHKAGVTLRHLHIARFPSKSNHKLICPGNKGLDDPAWDDFAEACRNLKTFSIGNYNASTISPGIWNFKKEYVDKFLMASLSSEKLEKVKICVDNIGTKRNQTGLVEYYDLGSVLSNVKWPNIREIHISDISLNGWEFEKFSRGLGGCLRQILLNHWRLKEGRWSGAIDIMRDRLLTGRDQKKLKVWLYNLKGGEFGVEEVKQQSGPRLFDGRSHSKVKDIALFELSVKYLIGDIAVNPLVDL